MKAFAPLALLLSAVTASKVHYPVLRRSEARARQLQDDEDFDEMAISFEGSVTDIQELAMKAALEGSPTASFACPGSEIDHLEPLTWVYSIEYEEGSDPAEIISEMELALRAALAPRILACQSDDHSDKQIVSVDSSPGDLPDPDETCDPSSADNECSVYQGRMRLFLGDENTAEASTHVARTNIRDLFDSNTFVESIGKGLIDAIYLGPDIALTPPLISEPDDNTRIVGGDSGITNVSVALIATGSAAAIVLVGTFLYIRRNNDRDINGNGNSENNVEDDTMLGGTTCPPASPFTEFLPNAYRYTDELTNLSANPPNIQESGSGLSAVAELSGEEQSTVADEQSTMQESIVVSESGYTTEGVEDSVSFDMPKSLYMRAPDSPLLLGAKKRLDNSVTHTANVVNDSLSEMSTSEDESVNTNMLSVTQDQLSDENMSQSSGGTAAQQQQQQPDLLMDTLAHGILDESTQTDDEALLFL